MRFLAVNDAAVGQYGYLRDEFLGMTLNDLHPPEAVPSLAEVVAGLDAQNLAPLWRRADRVIVGQVLTIALMPPSSQATCRSMYAKRDWRS